MADIDYKALRARFAELHNRTFSTLTPAEHDEYKILCERYCPSWGNDVLLEKDLD